MAVAEVLSKTVTEVPPGPVTVDVFACGVVVTYVSPALASDPDVVAPDAVKPYWMIGV
jgi:hypothetical protein